ncbi:hypothetical protein [Frankia sp. Cr2]|uniref:hypothetical protein n=1 Tax=Frankia sp. Cr2 TaxID=3073932 RepID=UPI002AD2D688|nr:hypothetical protein [Frankia sp. Cr2]
MEHIEPLHALDWNDIDAVEHATRKALTQLADDPDLVRETLLGQDFGLPGVVWDHALHG